jgi:hypothetical protein
MGGYSVGGGSRMRQLALSEGPAKMGIRSQVQRAAIPSKVFFLIQTILVHLIILIIMYVHVYKKKEIIILCRLKLNHASGIETCIYSWLNGQHGREQLFFLSTYFITICLIVLNVFLCFQLLSFNLCVLQLFIGGRQCFP